MLFQAVRRKLYKHVLAWLLRIFASLKAVKLIVDTLGFKR